jgi:outer membrane biosynthesis protein TonB
MEDKNVKYSAKGVIKPVDSRLRKKIIIISILLHALFFALWEAGIILDLFGKDVLLRPAADIQPIVLDLRQPESERSMPREVIETPEDAKVVEKQDRADFLSDKNALARNQEPDANVPLGEAFSRGDLDTHELPRQEGPLGKTLDPAKPDVQQPEQKPQPQEQKPETADTYVNILRPPNSLPSPPPGIQERLPSVRHDNPGSRVEDTGGLSFNTYNWDFAPYLIMLKHRIQRNIFPPPAFSQLGIIDGETMLRFKIYPNGQLKDLAILNYKGHESLMITSRNAVESSAPFPGLPKDFPEPYLEVTGKFIYFVRR